MRAWNEFLLKQEREIGRETVNKWLRPLRVVCFDACNLYLEAAESFAYSWFEEHMRHKVDREFFNNNGKRIKVHLSLFKLPLVNSPEVKESLEAEASRPIFFRLHTDSLSKNFTFDNFRINQGNELAYKLFKDAVNFEDAFNPVYLFGLPGSGKTHLLIATARRLIAEGKKIVYSKADTFTYNVVSAIRNGEMQKFRSVCRKADALFIDDIDHLSGKAATQEEFFHTFNSLHIEGKLICLASRMNPQELKGIEDRLVSRFEWGIVVSIQPLKDIDLREFFIERLKEKSIFPSEVIITFLCKFFYGDMKRAVELVNEIPKRLKGKEKYCTFEKLQEIFKDFLDILRKNKLTPATIITVVAQYYGIRIEDVLSKSQSRENVVPRQVAMHLCREYLAMPYIKIGDIFLRDHSTVMSAVKHIKEELESGNRNLISALNLIGKSLA
ncbi:MAG: DnaA/Hda family protein [Victivallaceae bacterium]